MRDTLYFHFAFGINTLESLCDIDDNDTQAKKDCYYHKYLLPLEKLKFLTSAEKD